GLLSPGFGSLRQVSRLRDIFVFVVLFVLLDLVCLDQHHAFALLVQEAAEDDRLDGRQVAAFLLNNTGTGAHCLCLIDGLRLELRRGRGSWFLEQPWLLVAARHRSAAAVLPRIPMTSAGLREIA